MGTKLKVVFFTVWFTTWCTGTALFFANVNWRGMVEPKLNIGYIIETVLLMTITSLLLVDITEGFTVSLMSCFYCGRKKREPRGDHSSLTTILNYNLLANSKGEIDECYERMYTAFMGNLTGNLSAVLLSATRKEELRRYELTCRQRYREKIFSKLYDEGLVYIEGRVGNINPFRWEHVWRKTEKQLGMDYLVRNLESFCQRFCQEFMCIHRVGRVLRKVGQYQDLMLLSDGYWDAFTYCDPEFHGTYARTDGEPMFYDSQDARNIFNRKYDYTFVLDSDTVVPPGVVNDLLAIAANRPEKGIIQPAIELKIEERATYFMRLEKLRSLLGKPAAFALSDIMEQTGYYGKALMKNRLYIDQVIGHPGRLREMIPVDVLSHDTYEAAILKPYPVPSVAIYEAPPYNYITWDLRLRRWSLGDLILAMYFYDKLLGAPLRALQRLVQGKNFVRVKTRTKLNIDFVTFSICTSAIRQFYAKPLWFLFCIPYTPLGGATFHHAWAPIITVLALLTIFSKVPLLFACSRGLLYVFPELLTSVLQYTPEVLVGTLRIILVYIAAIRGKNNWVPQRTLEEFFTTTDWKTILVYSFKYLWGYTVLGVLLIVLFVLLGLPFTGPVLDTSSYSLLIFTFSTIALLPLFCFVTSLRNDECKTIDNSDFESSSVDSGSLGFQENGFYFDFDIPSITIPRAHLACDVEINLPSAATSVYALSGTSSETGSRSSDDVRGHWMYKTFIHLPVRDTRSTQSIPQGLLF